MSSSAHFLYTSSTQDHAVKRLHHWLNYQTKTLFIGGGLFWLPVGPITLLLIGAAFLFAPYLIWRLVQARRFVSVTIFVGFVLAPLIAAQFVDPQEQFLSYVLLFGPLLAFYLFTWVLKFVLGEAVEEIKGKRMLEYENAKHAI